MRLSLLNDCLICLLVLGIISGLDYAYNSWLEGTSWYDCVERVLIHAQFLEYPKLAIFEGPGAYEFPVSVAEAKNQVLTSKFPRDQGINNNNSSFERRWRKEQG